MTPEKITAASGMATVSTSSEVFMGQIQSIIDSKNKEATNKFASQGAKPKSKSFVLPPSLRDSYNNDRAALPITMNSGVNTTASIVSSGAPHPTALCHLCHRLLEFLTQHYIRLVMGCQALGVLCKISLQFLIPCR